MSTHKRIATSAEVWAVIRARHGPELVLFETFSDPDGRSFGGAGFHGEMVTVWGLPGADCPLMGACTEWDIVQLADGSTKRDNEHTKYWLCVNTKDDE